MNSVPMTHLIPHLCGMSRTNRMRRLVIVFRVFLDESGKNANVDKAFLMGGFLGRVDAWLGASDAWDEVLHESPRIEYFKSTEAQTLTGQFDRWKRTDAEKKVLSLATAISRSDLFGFCFTVSHKLFKDREPKALNVLGTKAYD